MRRSLLRARSQLSRRLGIFLSPRGSWNESQLCEITISGPGRLDL